MTATDTRPLPPVPTFPFSMFDPVHLGRDEYGEHVHVNLAERNMLLGGEPGAGKSSGLNLIVAHGALSRDCKLILVDGKQVELGRWRACANDVHRPVHHRRHRRVPGLPGTSSTAYDTLLAEGRRKMTRDDGESVYLIVIDEYAYFSATVGANPNARTSPPSRDLVARGRAAGVIVILETRRPAIRSSTRPWRNCSATDRRSCAPPAAPVTWCSATAGPTSSPPKSTRSPAASAGCSAKAASPRRIKAAYLDDDTIKYLAAYAARLRGKQAACMSAVHALNGHHTRPHARPPRWPGHCARTR